MNNERNDLKAGLFIIASVVLIIAIVIGIKGVSFFSSPMQTRTVTFTLKDDVGGLGVGDDVRIGGVRQGKVQGISFDDLNGNDPHIVIKFSLPKRFELRRDAHITTGGTLTGSSWLNIDKLGTGDQPSDGEAIAGSPIATSGTLIASLQDAVPGIKEAVANFAPVGPEAKQLIEHVNEKIDPVVKKYDAIADAGEATLNSARATADSAHATIDDIHAKAPPIMDHILSIATKTDAQLDHVQAVLADVQASTASVRGLLSDNRGRIDHMIAAMRVASDNLKAGIAEIRHSPWRVFYKPVPGEMANINVYDAARQFADGAGDLNDAATALRDSLNDPTVSKDPAKVSTLMEQLNQTFSHFSEVEQKLWTAVQQ